MSKTNYTLNTNEFLLQKLLYQSVVFLFYIKRSNKKRAVTIISNCLPCFLMEVFASQPGSVESLRKANDITGNNSTFRNLNQHCSACARVKIDPCVDLDLRIHFLSMSPASQIDGVSFQTWIYPGISPKTEPTMCWSHPVPITLSFWPFIPTWLTWNCCTLFLPSV